MRKKRQEIVEGPIVEAKPARALVFLTSEQISVIACGLKQIMAENRTTGGHTASIADNILLMTEQSRAILTISDEEKAGGQTVAHSTVAVPGENKVYLRLGEQELLERALEFVEQAARDRDPVTSQLAADLLDHIHAGDVLVCREEDETS